MHHMLPNHLSSILLRPTFASPLPGHPHTSSSSVQTISVSLPCPIHQNPKYPHLINSSSPKLPSNFFNLISHFQSKTKIDTKRKYPFKLQKKHSTKTFLNNKCLKNVNILVYILKKNANWDNNVKRRFTFSRSMEMHIKLLHPIIDHFNFVITHHPN